MKCSTYSVLILWLLACATICVESPEFRRGSRFEKIAFALPARMGLAGVLVVCNGRKVKWSHFLAISLGREELITVSRHPVLAAVPLNGGNRISFVTTPHAVVPITVKYCGLMASGGMAR